MQLHQPVQTIIGVETGIPEVVKLLVDAVETPFDVTNASREPALMPYRNWKKRGRLRGRGFDKGRRNHDCATLSLGQWLRRTRMTHA